MNKLFSSLLLTVAISFLLPACSKNSPAPVNNNGGGGTTGGGTTGGGTPSNTTIVYRNKTYTAVSITLNSVTKSIDPGDSVSFTGAAGATASGTATTSGKTGSGTQIGLLVTWTLSSAFPASGVQAEDLNAGTDYFFLKVVNNSGLSMLKMYVNYGLGDQTLDNITVPNDGKIYSFGYYHTYPNSNARAENGSTYWYWPSLGLPNTINQATVLTGN